MISVIMPVYNRADLVGESIESLLSQSYDNWELIITDSASTDNSLEVCKNYAKKDSRIKVLSTEATGVSQSRNVGLSKAVGDYVFFLDSDDVIHPELLKTLINAMTDTGAEIGGSGVRSVNSSSWQRVYEDIKKSDVSETKYLTFDEAISAVFSYVTPINLIGGVMISRKLIGETRFNTDLHIGEDFYFVYQNLIKGANAVFLDSLWYYGRLHNTNISKDYSFGGFWSRFHRRELVWQSEESFGRVQNVNRQKRDALNVYRSYLLRNNPDTPEGKQICKVVKSYKKQILPALSFKDKMNFYITTTFPKIYHKLILKTKKH